MGDEAHGIDASLSRERTELAWNRSGLSVVVAISIVLRRLWPLGGYKSDLALVFISIGAIVWAIGMRLARRARTNALAISGLRESHCFHLMVGTLLFAAAGMTFGLLVPR